MAGEGPVASRMVKAGASGYITKDSEPEQLVAALRKVAAGGRYIDAELAEQLAFGNGPGMPLHELLRELRVDVPSPRGDLSQRRKQLLGLAVLGDVEIGRASCRERV